MLVENLGSSVLALVQELAELLPPLPNLPPDAGKVIKVSNTIVTCICTHPLCSVEHELPVSEVFGSQLPDLRRFSRKVRKLNAVLQALLDQPTEFLTGLVVSVQQEEIESRAVESLDGQIAADNLGLFEAARTQAEPAVYVPRSRFLEPEPLIAVPGDVAPSDVEAPEAVTSLHEEVLTNLGTLPLRMPWINKDKPVAIEVERLTVAGKDVYIARGLSPRLETISRQVRQKSPTGSERVNEYDATALHMARRIALGIMPYQNANSVKSLRSTKSAAPYKGIAVWYSFDVSPNAPRVYFTLKTMADLLDETVLASAEIDPTKYCVIVLAETDKATQTEVLRLFTGRKHRHLRAAGSGSI